MKNPILAAAHSAIAALAVEAEDFDAALEAKRAEETAANARIERLRLNQAELDAKLTATATQVAETTAKLSVTQHEVGNTVAKAQAEANAIIAEATNRKNTMLTDAEKVCRQRVALAEETAATIAEQTAAAKKSLEGVLATRREAETRLSQLFVAAERLAAN